MNKYKPDTHINPLNRQAIRNAIIKDITKGQADFNYAVTLTFPYTVYNRKHAQERMLFFRDQYNAVLGYKGNHKRAAKYDPKLSAAFAAFIEGDCENQHYHYHIALHKPAAFSDERFVMMVNLLWHEVTHRKGTRTDCKVIYSDGWAEYITKQLQVNNTMAYDELNNNIY